MAQSDRSTLTGTITDPSGAVMPGVKVELVNQATGLKYAADTNEFGIYVVPQLPVGRYEMTAVATKGFKPFLVSFQLHVAETISLSFWMNLGGDQV